MTGSCPGLDDVVLAADAMQADPHTHALISDVSQELRGVSCMEHDEWLTTFAARRERWGGRAADLKGIGQEEGAALGGSQIQTKSLFFLKTVLNCVSK